MKKTSSTIVITCIVHLISSSFVIASELQLEQKSATTTPRPVAQAHIQETKVPTKKIRFESSDREQDIADGWQSEWWTGSTSLHNAKGVLIYHSSDSNKKWKPYAMAGLVKFSTSPISDLKTEGHACVGVEYKLSRSWSAFGECRAVGRSAMPRDIGPRVGLQLSF